MSYLDYLAKRVLMHTDYVQERYGSIAGAPADEIVRIVDYATDLAKTARTTDRKDKAN